MARMSLILALLALAARPACAQTLAPGKPAGTKAALQITQHGAFIAMSLAAVVLAITVPGSTSSTTTSTGTTG